MLLAAVILLSGCGTAEALSAANCAVEERIMPGSVTADNTDELYEKAREAAEKENPEKAAENTPRGINTEKSDKAVIDWSDSAEGYVSVKYLQKNDKTLRVQIYKDGSDYGYILSPCEWEVFPLSEGDGRYKVTLYENVAGSKYAVLLSAEFEVKLKNEFAPFLRANQYVNFSAAPVTQALAKLLSRDKTDPFDTVIAVFDFTVNRLSYDRELAATVKGGYVPQLDKVLEERKGICFDYAALMTGLLRSAGIPTRLVTGYASGVYHAWISVWSEETGWIDNVIFFDGEGWQRMDPTFADSDVSDSSLKEYIGDGSNYTEKYYY